MTVTPPVPEYWPDINKSPLPMERERYKLKQHALTPPLSQGERGESIGAPVTHDRQAADHDPFHARDTFETGSGRAGIYRLGKLEEAGLTQVGGLPYLHPRSAGSRCCGTATAMK